MGVASEYLWSTIRGRDSGRIDGICILLPRWDFEPRNDELTTLRLKLILIDPWMLSHFYELRGHVVPICTYPPTSTITPQCVTAM